MSETERALETLFAQIVRQMVVTFAVIGVLGLGIGYLAAGKEGLIGALMGLGVTVFFMGTSAVVMLATAKAPIYIAQAAFVGAWIVKMFLVLVLIAVVRDQVYYHPGVFFVVLAVSIIAATVIEMRAVMRARVPTIEPSGSSGT